jgi:hypothetical protein
LRTTSVASGRYATAQYETHKGKWNRILKEVAATGEVGSPILTLLLIGKPFSKRLKELTIYDTIAKTTAAHQKTQVAS